MLVPVPGHCIFLSGPPHLLSLGMPHFGSGKHRLFWGGGGHIKTMSQEHCVMFRLTPENVVISSWGPHYYSRLPCLSQATCLSQMIHYNRVPHSGQASKYPDHNTARVRRLPGPFGCTMERWDRPRTNYFQICLPLVR